MKLAVAKLESHSLCSAYRIYLLLSLNENVVFFSIQLNLLLAALNSKF